MGRKLSAAAAAGIAVAAAVLVVGCGSSQNANQGIGPVARAADVTSQVRGYRISATVNVTTPSGPAQITMSGVFNRARRTGKMTAQQTIAGHQLQFTEVFSGLTFYLKAASLSALKRLTGGKHWLKFDMSRMLGAMGLGSLPTAGTDPTQYVDFLRAVSSSTGRVGTETVRGVPTTHYHATVDLSKYPKLVPAANRTAAARGVATLESALGVDTMPMDVWIDHNNLVRRIGLSFSECVASQHIHLGMDMDIYGYGSQPRPRLPTAAEVYDLTPQLTASLNKLKFGCTTG